MAAEKKTYAGSCHCGRVRFEVQTDLATVLACNCSYCSRVAHLLTFVPAANFKLLAGEEALAEYLFNRKHIHHQFCSRCGIRAFGYGNGPDGQEMRSVNVRCLDGVDLDALTIAHFDGKNR